MPTSLFIYGSCVARDVVRVTKPHFEVNQYVARQTFASSFTNPLPAPDSLDDLKSRFQRTSVYGDVTSNLKAITKEFAPISDVVLIDIATEHWGVVPAGNSAYLTQSAELLKSEYFKSIRTGKRIEPGTDQHFRLFRNGAIRYKALLERIGVFDRTFVLNAPFATHTIEGNKVPNAKGREPSYWQSLQADYFNTLSDLGYTIGAEPPSELIKSTSSHLWGPALYHYVDELYIWWADEIDRFVART